MNLIRKGQGQAHRGVIGVEAAIVMIAFVIIAAALAFVVLNAGFSTTQKAKTSLISSLGEASSSLEIVGTVVGIACHDAQCANNPLLNATAVPLKIASGGNSVNFDPTITAVTLVLNGVEYSDIYRGTINGTGNTASSIEEGFDEGITAGYLVTNPVDGTADQTDTLAFVYFAVADDAVNSILEKGEHAVLAVTFKADDRPATLDTLKLEIILATGATLTIEREIPILSTSIVNLG